MVTVRVDLAARRARRIARIPRSALFDGGLPSTCCRPVTQLTCFKF